TPSTDDYGSSPGWTFDRWAVRRTITPPAGRASGPTTRSRPPAARASRPGPGRSGMPAARARRPVAYRRPPDRAELGQVVRPVGRSTWTSSARTGRAKPARREAEQLWAGGPSRCTGSIAGPPVDDVRSGDAVHPAAMVR